MSGTQRAKLIAKLQSALKKTYSAPAATPSRPLLEHALYASLLEDCPADLADEGLVKLEQDYFDWNEVRVTTVTEIKSVLSSLPDPAKAAQRLKTNLQGIFEEFYTFDLDHLKKENLGKAVAKFESLPGMTPFVLSHIIQHGLGGHSIPIDYSAMVLMLVTGIANQSEAAAGRVPGLERAIPKTKGVEFSQLLHQPAVALSQNPKNKKARAFIESISKGASKVLDEWLESKEAAKERVAARRAEERETARKEAKAAEEEAKQKAAEKLSKASVKKPVKKPLSAAEQAVQTAERAARAKKAAARKTAKKSAAAPVPAKTAAKPSVGAKKPAKSPPEKKVAKKSAAAEKANKPAKKKPIVKKPSAKKVPEKKSATKKAATKKSGAATKPLSKKTTPAKGKASSAAGKKKPPSSAGKSAKKKPGAKKSATAKSKAGSAAGKKATNRKLTKRKPR